MFSWKYLKTEMCWLEDGLEEIEVPLANTRDSSGLSPGFGLFRSFHFNTFCICFTSVKPLARECLQTLYCTVYSMWKNRLSCPNYIFFTHSFIHSFTHPLSHLFIYFSFYIPISAPPQFLLPDPPPPLSLSPLRRGCSPVCPPSSTSSHYRTRYILSYCWGQTSRPR